MLRSGYSRRLRFPILNLALPGLKHGQKTEGNLIAQIDMNSVFDRNIPAAYANELGEFKNKIQQSVYGQLITNRYELQVKAEYDTCCNCCLKEPTVFTQLEITAPALVMNAIPVVAYGGPTEKSVIPNQPYMSKPQKVPIAEESYQDEGNEQPHQNAIRETVTKMVVKKMKTVDETSSDDD